MLKFKVVVVLVFKSSIDALVLFKEWTVLTFRGLIFNFASQYTHTGTCLSLCTYVCQWLSHYNAFLLLFFYFHFIVFVVVIIITTDDDLPTFFKLQNGFFRYCIDPYFFPPGLREYHLIFCKATGLWKRQKIILGLSSLRYLRFFLMLLLLICLVWIQSYKCSCCV